MSGNPYVDTRVKCAGPGCEHVRESANRWFVVSFASYGRDDAFTCFPFQLGNELDESERPVCGSACAQKLFEQFLSK
jgi:hypothetical protein